MGVTTKKTQKTGSKHPVTGANTPVVDQTVYTFSQLYRIPEVAQLTGLAESTIRLYIAQGKLRAYRLGGRSIRIKAEDLEGLLTQMSKSTYARVNGGGDAA